MTKARLSEILAAYGADPARWPAAERDAALALIARSADLSHARAAAQRLDRLLDRAVRPAVALDAVALAAAASAAPQPLRRRRTGFAPWTGLGWPRLAGLAASAVAGFAIGWSGLELGTQAEIAALEQLLVMEDLPPW